MPNAIRRAVAARARPYSTLAALALSLGLTIGILYIGGRDGWFNTIIFWDAGRDVLDGRSPYPPLDLEVLAGKDQFVYPAPAALVFAVLALLPYLVAGTIINAFVALGIAGAAWVVGVRGPWAIALAVTSLPVVFAMYNGAITGVLALLIALAWRWRDRAWQAGLAVGAAAALKVLPFAVVAFFVLTRRWRAVLTSTIATIVLVVGGWAVLGFDGMLDYPHMLSLLADGEQHLSFSAAASFMYLGAAVGLSKVLGYAAAATVGLVAVWRALRGDELGAFAFVVLAMIVASPVVWIDYFALLYVAFMARRPSFDRWWLLLPGTWLLLAVDPVPVESDQLHDAVAWLAFATALAVLSTGPGRGREPRPADDRSGRVVEHVGLDPHA